MKAGVEPDGYADTPITHIYLFGTRITATTVDKWEAIAYWVQQLPLSEVGRLRPTSNSAPCL